jgi:hypothetical protein
MRKNNAHRCGANKKFVRNEEVYAVDRLGGVTFDPLVPRLTTDWREAKVAGRITLLNKANEPIAEAAFAVIKKYGRFGVLHVVEYRARFRG